MIKKRKITAAASWRRPNPPTPPAPPDQEPEKVPLIKLTTKNYTFLLQIIFKIWFI